VSKQRINPASQSEGTSEPSLIQETSPKLDDLFRTCPESISQGASTSSDTHPADDCWPVGTNQRLNHLLARRIFDLISTSTTSIYKLLKVHPELPPYRLLYRWRAKYPWFKQGWQQAREQQAEFLIQKTLDLAHNATHQTAHLARVQFDIYRFVAAKFSPTVYGDKPSQTNLAVQVNVVSQERIQELRSRLEAIRQHLKDQFPQVSRGNSKPKL
jgi:hypothetical protein